MNEVGEGKSQRSEIMERAVEVKDIEVEERGGFEVLVVEDSSGNRYSTLRDSFVENIPEKKDRYIGETWELRWSITAEGFLNFHGFGERTDREPVEEKIDPDDYEIVRRKKSGLDERDLRITRQSAGHDAARIVSGMISSGDRALSEQEIKHELKKWSEYFQRYYRSGEWEED
ncbi:MAG: hypothetical protein ABEK01_05655 [Candidatus Nanohaloarchaea archaeon]